MALWISKFILPELLEDIVQTCYFPLGIRIAKGVVFPLAPLILGHLYTQMDSLHRLECLGAGGYILETYALIGFLQAFFWERFLAYAPKPFTCEVIESTVGNFPFLGMAIPTIVGGFGGSP